MNEKRKYDSTIARIAGNLLSGSWPEGADRREELARLAVMMARAVVAEVERTEPKAAS